MHCAICDADSETVTLTEPCATCQEVIQDCLAGYEDFKNTDELEVLDVGC